MENEKVRLAGFDLPDEEIERVNITLEHYIRKIQENLEFESLELTLKKSLKGKAYNHEIRANLRTKGKILSSNVSNYNIFKAVALTLEKILHEAQHLRRTSRQVK